MGPQFIFGAAVVGAFLLFCRLFTAQFEKERRAREKRELAMSDGLMKDEMAKTDRLFQRTPRQLWLAKSGTPATARIVAAQQTNTMINQRPLVDLILEVHGPEGTYQVQMQVVLSVFDIASCQTGETVDVRIDPKNRADVVIVL